MLEERFIPVLEGCLDGVAKEQAISREVKWQNVDSKHAEAFSGFMNAFFDELAGNYFRVRVLFLDRYLKSSRREGKRTEYFKLYYHFITRAFGWQYAPFTKGEKVYLRLFLDKLPDQGETKETFKQFLSKIPETERFQNVRLVIPPDGISEIDSRKHRIAQAIDVIIGALGFRMNDFHKAKSCGKMRGKRTRAKEKVYKVIQERLRDFGVKNIGINTGLYGNWQRLWTDPIRLWRLKPRDYSIDSRWTKK